MRTLCFSVLLVTCLTSIPSNAFACSLQVASINFEPYFWLEKGKVTGINRDFYAYIGRQIGCDISFRVTPWKRVIRGLKNGDVDIATAFYNPEREQFATYSTKPISQVKFHLFARVDTPFTPSLGAFFRQARTVLYPKNWYLGGLKQQLLAKPRLIYSVSSLEKGIDMLLKNRADALLASSNGLSTLLKKANLSHKIVIKSPVLSQVPIYSLLSKKGVDDTLYHKIDIAIKDALSQGVMTQIENQYQR